MASVSNNSGNSQLDVELNLVPFIDLLSTLVLFLLVTAVWTQVANISANTQGKGRTQPSPSKPELISVQVSNEGIRVSGMQSGQWSRRGGQWPYKDLQILMKRLTAENKARATVLIDVGDQVPYEAAIATLDAVRGAGIKKTAISAN